MFIFSSSLKLSGKIHVKLTYGVCKGSLLPTYYNEGNPFLKKNSYRGSPIYAKINNAVSYFLSFELCTLQVGDFYVIRRPPTVSLTRIFFILQSLTSSKIRKFKTLKLSKGGGMLRFWNVLVLVLVLNFESFSVTCLPQLA